MTHTHSPVVQRDDYYPFGLTFNSQTREDATAQRWKFQGQEHVDDLGLNWDSFKWRNHQPDIGRFFNVDPLAEERSWLTPYNFVKNNPLLFTDPTGLLDSTYTQQMDGTFKAEYNGTRQDVYNFSDGGTMYVNDDGSAGSFVSAEAKVRMANRLEEYKNKSDGERFGELLETFGDGVTTCACLLAPFTEGASMIVAGAGEAISLIGTATKNYSRISSEGATKKM